MIRDLIEKGKKWHFKHKLNAHVEQLYQSCMMGNNFCKSPFYSDSLSQLLNVKINNTTGDRTRIRFGSFCNLTVNIFLNTKGSITIGDYVFMNSVIMRIDYDLKIGSHCLFGGNVRLWDTDNHPLSLEARHEQCEEIAHSGRVDSYMASGGSIIIGDDVWIGMDVIVFGGVTIGNGSVIAAGSIVTKSIPENVLAGGVPARVLKNL